MDNKEEEESKVLGYEGTEILDFDYARRMEFEEAFRSNYIQDIQQLYEKIGEYLDPPKFTLQDFTDFCFENSYIEEEVYYSDSDDSEEEAKVSLNETPSTS